MFYDGDCEGKMKEIMKMIKIKKMKKNKDVICMEMM
jgi:hypothetical protein